MTIKFNVSISRAVVKKPYSVASKLNELTRKPLTTRKDKKVKQLTKNNHAFLRSLKLL
jgi:hypothetical protein